MPKLFSQRVVAVLLGWGLAGGLAQAQGGKAPLSAPTGPTLVFSPLTNEYTAKPDELTAVFTIYVTNVWTNSILIQEVQTSCHCTVAELPANPWVLVPGGSGAVSAHVDLTGQDGSLEKWLTFFTSVGEKEVALEITIPPPARRPDQPLTPEERAAARLKAEAEPRAIFQGDCAVCHVERARGLLGRPLYVASCGICHESPQRAGIVPDLRALAQATNRAYWKAVISLGKPHTLMPGFAEAEGGPLSEGQVESLTEFLEATMPPGGRGKK